jgi:hypothetical protein
MTNEEKAERLEEIAQYYPRMGDKDAALLREAAQLMREQGQLRPLGSSKQELFIVWWSEIKQRIPALLAEVRDLRRLTTPCRCGGARNE